MHLRAELGGEVDRLPGELECRRARRLVGGAESALREARVEVEPARDAVDPVAVERLAHLVEVLRRELLRVVELVAVDQVAEPLDCRPHACGRGLAGALGLVAAGMKRVAI